MIDHRRFLGAEERSVLPYLGGPFVAARDRRLRVVNHGEPGWIEFSISGRDAEPIGPATRPDLSDLAAVRGHVLGDYLVQSDARAEVLFLAAEGEAAVFAPVTARRWPTGTLLFEAVEYETGAEETVRQAFEERRTLAGLGGIAAPLRAAFGYAVVMRFASERGRIVSPAEVRLEVGALADEGDGAAGPILDRIEREREQQLRRTPVVSSVVGGRGPVRHSDEERIDTALAAAGGQVLATNARGDLLEVRFVLRGERFSSLVHPDTLQVMDAGICLDGAQGEVTIESLPSVILEGMDTHQLYITRRG